MNNSQKITKSFKISYKSLEKSLKIFGLKIDKHLSVCTLLTMLKKS